MSTGTDIYYKAREVVRQLGHSETESCRVYKDWHIELRVGSGHVSVWTSAGLVYLTMLEKPVHYRPGVWEEYLSRLHAGRPEQRSTVDLRDLLRTQIFAEMEKENGNGADVGGDVESEMKVEVNDVPETEVNELQEVEDGDEAP